MKPADRILRSSPNLAPGARPGLLARLHRRAVRWPCVLASLAIAAALAGCATPAARTEVSTFHQWPGTTAPTYELTRAPSQTGSLEFDAYERTLREQLRAAGFVPASPARYRVAMDYKVVQDNNIGARPSPLLGLGGFIGSGVGVSVGVPIGGGQGGDTNLFTRTVRLMIDDAQAQPSASRVWESTATSVGNTPSLTEALPAMLGAMLADFPGPSGGTRTVQSR